jgi:hypothetical protein
MPACWQTQDAQAGLVFCPSPNRCRGAPIRLGKRIEWTPRDESVERAEADALIRKTYRKGFELPV